LLSYVFQNTVLEQGKSRLGHKALERAEASLAMSFNPLLAKAGRVIAYIVGNYHNK